MKTLGEIGEDGLIERLVSLVPLAADSPAGPGDDCAVIELGPTAENFELLKTDALVAGVHFTAETPARAVGWKAVARVVSDFAAMGGGRAERFLVTLALPRATEIAWVEDLYRGIGDCLKAFGAVLAGGETSRVPAGSAAVISIAATGSVRRDELVLRSGAMPGDELLVTGTLGGSLAGRHLSFMPRVREAQWLARHFKPSAMMDLSDGLAKDLPRLAAASQCGYHVDYDALPLTPGCTLDEALGDGEDFELLLAIGSDKSPALLAAWCAEFPDLPLSRIGRMVAAGEGDHLSGGWDHFR